MNICTKPTTTPAAWLRSVTLATLLATATGLALGGCSLLGVHAPITQAASGQPEQAAEKPPAAATPEDRFDAAIQLMKAHQDNQAIAAFKALTVDVPKASGPLTNLGILYARNGQWNKATPTLKKAVSTNSKNAVALNWLGIAERHQGHYKQARDAYRQALKVQSDSADPHLNLAILYDRYLHQPEQAIKQYQAYAAAAGTHRPIVSAWIKGLQHAKANTHDKTPPVATDAGNHP